MLSRVAESIFWMCRQVERAENLARFLEATHALALDQPESMVEPWSPLIRVTADDKLFAKHHSVTNAETVTQFLAFDQDYSNSMIANLRHARENARGVRESISSEAFEQLNEFYGFVKDAANQVPLDSPNAFFDSVRRLAVEWNGVLDGTMPRDIVWHFANVGRLLERADKTSRILDVKYFSILPSPDDVGTAVDDIQWSAVVSAIGGLEAYRRKHRSIDIMKVIDFFLFNSAFPRSLEHCVAGVHQSLIEIEAVSQAESSHVARQLVADLQHRLSTGTAEEVVETGMHEFIDSLQTELNQIGIAMNQDYFHSVSTS